MVPDPPEYDIKPEKIRGREHKRQGTARQREGGRERDGRKEEFINGTGS
jgi:hypothetical protein